MPGPFDQALHDLDAQDASDPGAPPTPAGETPNPAPLPEPKPQPTDGDPFASARADLAQAPDQQPPAPIPMPSQREVALRASLRAAGGQSPDAAAQTQALARQTGLPPDTVARNRDQVAAAVRANAVDPKDLVNNHPALAGWLSDPHNAAIARDDVAALQHLDLTVRMLTDVAKPQTAKPQVDLSPTAPSDPLPWMRGVVGAGARNASLQLSDTVWKIPAIVQSLYRTMAGTTDMPGRMTPLGEIYGAEDLRAAAAKARETYAPSAIKDIGTGVVSAGLDPTSYAAPAAGQSIALARMTALASAEQRTLATLKAVSAMQGIQGGAQALEGKIAERKAQGGSGVPTASDAANALAQGALGALTMRATGLVGPMALLKDTPLTLRQVPADMASNAALMGTQGAVGEQLDSSITGSPQPTAGDLARAYVQGGALGALMSGANIPGAAFASRSRAIAEGFQAAQQAHQDAMAIARLGDAVQASKTSARSPAAIQDLISRIGQASGRPDAGMVYLQTEPWDAHFTAAGADPEQVARAMTGNPEAYAQAKATGAPLAVPTDAFAAHLGPTEHFAPLMEAASLHPGGMTLAEGNRFLESAPEAIQQLGAEFKAEVEAHQAARAEGGDAVREQVKEQLINAGMDASAADTSARAHEAFFSTMASHFTAAGKPTTATALADRFPLAVHREVPTAIQGQPFDAQDVAFNRLRAGDLGSQQEAFGKPLTDFLREKGGIIDDTGDLKHIGADEVVPFKKKLINPKGVALDTAAEMAHEAGYLKERDLNDLIDKINDELHGKPSYSFRQHNAAKHEEMLQLEELRDYLGSIGADPAQHTNEEIRAKMKAAGGEERGAPAREAAQGGKTLDQAVEVKGASLELRELVKRWNKVSPERRAVPGDGEWQRLQEVAARVDAAKGKSYDQEPIERASVPYGAGHSDGSDGEAIYVDHHIPERLSVEKSDGSGHAELNPLDYLRRHEGFEETLMRHGMGYARAHELATAFEHEALRAAGFDPVSYERAIKPYLDQAMHQHGRDIPEDLDRQPYREEGQERVLYQAAFHGTGNHEPYKRFDINKVGGEGGEGAQAFGHGLYFAGRKEVAEHYRDVLSPVNEFHVDGQSIEKHAAQHGIKESWAGVIDSVLQATNGDIKGAIAHLRREKGNQSYEKMARYLESLEPSQLTRQEIKMGRLYHVEVPEDHEMLSWDKPLRLQTPEIQEKIAKLVEDHPNLAKDIQPSTLGEGIYRVLSQELSQENPQGNEGDRAASEELHERGIPGIRYLDNASRDKGEGTHNYVVFDDSRINIQRYEQAKRGSITISGGRFAITLTPHADLSTFLHESGHYFLEVMNHLGSAEGAPAQIKADQQAILDWLGVKDHAAIGVDQHEQFARAIEHYFMEGKAPSVGLRPVFQRFKAWLQLLYGKLTALHVQISPEVHAVFDRMFASDHEIQAARERAGDTQVLPREHFASDEEYGRYKDAAQHAHDTAESALRTELMRAYQREHVKRWQDERDTVRATVESEVNARPAYVAISALRDGTLPDGRPLPAGMEIRKLSRADLVDRYDEEALTHLPGPSQRDAQGNRIPKANRGRRLYATEGGMDLDEAASRLGFQSGDQLFQALVNAPDRRTTIEAEADARMRERHPDPMTDGTIAERADVAIANEQRGKLLTMEVANLATKANAVPTPRELLKITASRVINETAIGNLRPDLYKAAEAKARRKAFDAAATGDHGTAFTESQRALLNHELFRRAAEAKDQSERIQRFATGLTEPAARERIGKAGGWEWTITRPGGSHETATTEQAARESALKQPGSTFDRTSSYLDQIDAILDRYSFARQSQKAKLRTMSMATWTAKQMASKGLPEIIVPEVMRENLFTPWQRLTVNQLGGVYDTLRNIASQARGMNRLLEEARDKALSDRATAAATAMIINKPEAIKHRQGSSPFSTLTDRIGQFFNWQARVPDLIWRMDGYTYGGAMFKAWQLGLNTATDRKLLMTNASIEHVNGLVDAWGKLGPKGINAFRLNVRERIPAINDSLNKWAQIMVAIHYGSDGNRERLLEGNKWTDAQAMAVINRLDKADIALVNGLVKHINSYWSEIAALEQRTHGFAPTKVQALPYEAAGGHVDGGYAPIVYDNRQSKAGRPNADQEAQDMLAGRGMASSYTSHGHTKERGDSQGRPLDLNFGVLQTHLGKVIHDLTMREALIDNNRLLLHDTFRTAVVGHYGDGAYDQFSEQLRGIASGPTRTTTGLEPFLGYVRMGGNAAMRAFNVAGSIQQLAGLPFMLPRLGFANSHHAVHALWSAFSPAAHHYMEEIAPSMKFRNAEHGKLLNEVTSRTSTLAPLHVFRDTAYLFYNTAWKVLDAHAWYSMYYSETAKGRSEADAAQAASQFVPDTQGAVDVKDMSAMMRGGELSKVWTNNMGWANASLNSMLGSMHQFVDRRYSGAAAAKMVADMGVYLVVAPAIYMGMRQALSGQWGDLEDPSKEAKRLGWEMAYTVLSSMPFGRELAPLLEHGRRYEGPQGGDAMGTLLSAGSGALHQAKHPKPGQMTTEERLAIQTAGILFHFPADQVLHMLDGWHYADTHQVNPILPTLMGPPPRK